MYPPFDDADPTDERMVSALNFALSGRGDSVDDAALALGLALAGRSGGHGARHSSLSPSESSVASTTSMMSTSSFASSLAPADVWRAGAAFSPRARDATPDRTVECRTGQTDRQTDRFFQLSPLRPL